MKSDYNDVGKLLEHMDLSGFSYRSFRKHEDGAAAAPAAPASENPAAAQPAAQAPRKDPAVAAQTAHPVAAPPVAAPTVVAAPPPAVAPAVAAPPVAAQQPVPPQSGLQAAAPAVPPPAPKLRMVRPLATPPAPAAGDGAAEGRIGATLDRLLRSGTADPAPKLRLHLELPTRPTLDAEPARDATDEPPIENIFHKLQSAAAKPRAASGKER